MQRSDHRLERICDSMKLGDQNTMSERNKFTRDTLINCLSEQLSEIDLLKSMYPNHDEIVLTDIKAIDDIKNFIESESSDYTPSHLDFVIKLNVDGLKLEVCINLPTFYPEEEPDIYIRCNQLNRQQETNLNTALSNSFKSNYTGEVCLHTAISWLQENMYYFVNEPVNDDNSVDKIDDTIKSEDKFVRLWIYSHHIYNKKKREEISKLSKELKLTGFCLPGKPGIICIEGSDSDCKLWWRDIKSLSWKKIVIRKTEVFDASEQNQQQKFITFEEIHFQNPSARHSKHADLSGFSKFMEERGLAQAFNEFFGLCSDMNLS